MIATDRPEGTIDRFPCEPFREVTERDDSQHTRS